nr:hypothetical protein FVER53263_07203 [Fusarium verticillioides]
MWSLYFFTAFLAVSPAIAKKSPKPCPTVTTTATLCTTCVVPACLTIETISSQRNCPSKVPTSGTSFPCSKSKCPSGCATSYTYASAYGTVTKKPKCPTVTETATICSDCIRPMCLSLETVSSVCGCPESPATVTTSFPCGEDCPVGCGTDASASFELVDETRCTELCIAGDETSGKCGGQDVLSLYQIDGCDGGHAKNGTVPPVVQTPCTLCGQATLVPTPTAVQRKAGSPCPFEGCKAAPAPIATPAGNSTAKICPSGGCSSGGQGGQSGSGGAGGQGGTTDTQKGSSGEGSKAAPGLASESPRLYSPSILSAIAAVIFGLRFL